MSKIMEVRPPAEDPTLCHALSLGAISANRKVKKRQGVDYTKHVVTQEWNNSNRALTMEDGEECFIANRIAIKSQILQLIQEPELCWHILQLIIVDEEFLEGGEPANLFGNLGQQII